jgi:propionyl-CoA synthetase
LRALFLAGERADPDSLKWAERSLNVPVRDHWWQTETGWPICANVVGAEGLIPVKYGSTFRPCVGYDVQIVDETTHAQTPANTLGKIVVKLPLPPGALTTLYKNESRFVKSYLQDVRGYYDTGDAGYIDEDGYVYIMARTDDVINVAGHRLSSGAMEEVIADHPDVAEVAVVGKVDDFKGQIPLGLIVLNAKVTKSKEMILKEVIQSVRDRIGPVASFKDAVFVERLPKTRSGKVLRGTLRAIANDDDYKVPATIEDPTVLTEIAHIIQAYHS